MPSNPLILCFSLLLLLSIIKVFSNESVLHIRWPKYWRFSFNTNPSNEYLGLISFRMDWSDTLAVQGTLKSLFQHHSSKASIPCLTSPQNSRHRYISLPKTLFSIQPLYHPIIDFTSSFLYFSKCFTHSPHCSIQMVFFSCPKLQHMTKS